MIRRVKQAVVESYIGAIALGYLLAQVVWHFVDVFAAPLTFWASGKEMAQMTGHSNPAPFIAYRDAIPEMVRFVLLLLIWCILVPWLYYGPVEGRATSENDPAPAAGRPTMT